jgi:uncharacterized membrane protein YeaQ/YmgE (transglycosylase-associated protein family)
MISWQINRILNGPGYLLNLINLTRRFAMGILSWIIMGLIVGLLAKFVMPGKDPGGIIITILLGIAGAFVGGLIGSALGLGTVTGFNIGSFLLALGGAILLLLLYRSFIKKRRPA